MQPHISNRRFYEKKGLNLTDTTNFIDIKAKVFLCVCVFIYFHKCCQLLKPRLSFYST